MGAVQLQLIDGQRSLAWTIGPDGARIGRAAPCEIAIPSLQVSREHARIRFRDGVYLLEDLGSRNGTLVNGRPARIGGQILEDGDIILLGDTIEITARLIEANSQSRVVADLRRGEVWVGAVQVKPALPAGQLELLALLLRTSGQIVGHPAVVAAAWPGVDPAAVDAAAVDQVLRRIENRLRAAGWRGSLGTVTAAGGVRSAIFEELRSESAA
ncbi:MAG: FHA domain-containing protein [Dehalococcoidia bacterium]